MPKVIEYPRASLANSLELADAVSRLGGTASLALAAEGLNRKQGGAFTALISAAIKYGLVNSKAGKLTVQQAFRDYKLAYDEEEKQAALRKAILSPPTFRQIFERFEGKALPIQHFDKLLIREFEVPEDQASKVASYFVEGAKLAGILDSADNLLCAEGQKGGDVEEVESPASTTPDRREVAYDGVASRAVSEVSEYSVTFKGPGLNSTIVVTELEDLLIVEAMLKKVRRAVEERET